MTLLLYIIASVTVGVYSSKNAQTSQESYFLAGRDANKWVAGISMLSGLSSGISFLGIPAFSFQNGLLQIYSALSMAAVTLFVAYFMVPFYVQLPGGMVTAYSYLEARFSRLIRSIAAFFFVMRVSFYLAIVLYAPAIAIETVTGLSNYVSISVCGVLATLYTMKGGMQAEIMTDFMQTITLLAGTLLCLAYAVGGTEPAADGAAQSAFCAATLTNGSARFPDSYYPGRGGEFNPLRKQDVWSVNLGYLFSGVGQNGADQIAVQRYLSTPSLASTQFTVLMGGFLNGLSLLLAVTLGLSVFAYYESRGVRLLGGTGASLGKADQVLPAHWLATNPP